MQLLNQPEPVYGDHPNTGFNELPAVYQVDPDEWIYGYLELDLTAPDSKSVRRYQIIIVQTGEGRAQYVADMGLSELWGIDQIFIPCEFVVSAAKAMDVANEIRNNKMKEQLNIEPEDLYNGYFDMMEERVRETNKLSQFGPHYRVQRS